MNAGQEVISLGVNRTAQYSKILHVFSYSTYICRCSTQIYHEVGIYRQMGRLRHAEKQHWLYQQGNGMSSIGPEDEETVLCLTGIQFRAAVCLRSDLKMKKKSFVSPVSNSGPRLPPGRGQDGRAWNFVDGRGRGIRIDVDEKERLG